MQQLTDNLSLSAGKDAQGFAFSSGAPELTHDLVISEEHLRLVFDTIPCGVVVWSAPDQVAVANKTAVRILDVNLTQMSRYLLAPDCPVRSTVNLAHSFGLRVVAEGVEDESTLRLLTRLHCDLAQGYYLFRPLPAQGFERWLDETGENAFA